MGHLATLNFSLGEDIDMLRDTVNRFAADEIARRAAAIDEENLFPHDLWRKLGDIGVLGLDGQRGIRWRSAGLSRALIAMEEISRASAAVGLSFGAHSNLCVNQLRPQWQRRAEGEVSAQTRVGRARRRPRDERTECSGPTLSA